MDLFSNKPCSPAGPKANRHDSAILVPLGLGITLKSLVSVVRFLPWPPKTSFSQRLLIKWALSFLGFVVLVSGPLPVQGDIAARCEFNHNDQLSKLQSMPNTPTINRLCRQNIVKEKPRKSSALSRRRWPRRPLPHRLDQAGFLASAILVFGPGNNFPD